MQTLSARSYRELISSLSGIELDVPARGDKEDKRTTTHVERWSICRFLATYGNTRVVRYPLTVEKRERPDYRLNSRGLVVGVEITEAVSEDMARIDAMRHSENEPIPLDVSLFRPGNPRRTTQELRAILDGSRSNYEIGEDQDNREDEFDSVSSRIMGPGWAGDGVERDWAAVMHRVIESKATSALKPGYTYFDESWLLIYDNWSFPMLDFPRAMQHLMPKLAPLWARCTFQRVFVEHRNEFLHISAPHFSTRSLNNLWQAR